MFRSMALGMSVVTALFFVVSANAIVTMGDRWPLVGWSSTPGQRPLVTSVDSTGPAAGLLQTGDAIVAFNGDSRIVQLGVAVYRRFMAVDSTYTMRVNRAGTESDVRLTVGETRDSDSLLLVVSLWLAALVTVRGRHSYCCVQAG